jgi:alditol oxidase
MAARAPDRAVNWAGNIEFSASQRRRPRTVGELQDLVADSTRVHALGAGHSFSAVADSPGMLVSLADIPAVIKVDAGRGDITVSAGVRYGELAQQLHAAGLALPALASLPHISVAGACATGTHGSGDAVGNLATAVRALTMVTADGELTVLDRNTDAEIFRGAVVGLGALGIVTELTLDVIPTFDVRQYVYQDLPVSILTSRLDEIFASAYSVSVFTDWQGASHDQLWLKCRTDQPERRKPEQRWMGARLADVPVHPVPGMPASSCTAQLGVPGPWFERLPHFRLDFTPSSGDELQSEYLIPRELAAQALELIASLSARLAPVLQISEIRTVAPDDLWLSPSYQRPTVALHFTWIKDNHAVAPVIAALEEKLAPLHARPHWGKVFATPPATIDALYERSADFRALLRRYDPGGKFRNDFIDRYFPASNTPGR